MREAIVTLSDSELEAMGFGALISVLREAELRDEELLEDRGSNCVPQVEAKEGIDLDEVATFECVDGADLVAEKDESYVYLFELTATELPEGTPDDHDALISGVGLPRSSIGGPFCQRRASKQGLTPLETQPRPERSSSNEV